MATASSTEPLSSKRLTQRELIAEFQKLYSGKGIRRDALPSEVAAWVADARRHRESGQE